MPIGKMKSDFEENFQFFSTFKVHFEKESLNTLVPNERIYISCIHLRFHNEMTLINIQVFRYSNIYANYMICFCNEAHKS